MPDSRFFEDFGPVALIELAALSGARLAHAEDAERRIASVAPLGRAGADDISFFADRRYLALGFEDRADRSYDFGIKRTLADYTPAVLQSRGTR